jgi:hypothetical protein
LRAPAFQLSAWLCRGVLGGSRGRSEGVRVRPRTGAAADALDKDQDNEQPGESQFGYGDSINSVVLAPLKRAPRDDKRMTGCSSDKSPGHTR